MALVGKKAPHFSTDAVISGGEFAEDFSLHQYIGKKYVIFFFYPLDFTFVCPTELIAFQNKLAEFEKTRLRCSSLFGRFKIQPRRVAQYAAK